METAMVIIIWIAMRRFGKTPGERFSQIDIFPNSKES